MTSPVDIRPDQLEIVRDILLKHLPAGVKVWVFGSRANWTTKDSSDLDLALGSESKLSHKVLGALKDAFEDSALPYTVDVVDLNRIGDSFRQIVESEKVPLAIDRDGTGQRARQKASDRWREVPLGEIAEIYDGPHATPQKTGSGPVFLGISNLVDGRIDLSTSEHLSEHDYLTWTRRVTPIPGDIVFSYETRLGEAAAIPDGLRCCLGRRMGLLRPRAELVDSRFLLYAYLGPSFQETLRSRAVQGSTVDRILLGELGSFPIKLPRNVEEQRAIAHVLGTLDDKIELNRRMNETLEAMARALFKSWFVSFEPVRAKMEGRWRRGESLPGLAADLYDLFPDRLVDSELGEIPEGWEVKALGEVIGIHDSKRIPLNSRQRAERQGPYPYYGAAGIMDYVDDYLFDGIYVLIGEDGSVVDDEGYPVVQYVWGQFWVNNHAHVLTGKSPMTNEHLFMLLWQIEVLPYVTGAVQPKLSQTNLKSIPMVAAPDEVCRAFSGVIQPFFTNLRILTDQSRALATQRDALLPGLVSGKVRVDERQYYVE